MRLKRTELPPMSAIDLLKAGWLHGLSRDARATGWIFLKHNAIAETDKEAFREFVLACERRDADVADRLAALTYRARTVEELRAAQAATGLVW